MRLHRLQGLQRTDDFAQQVGGDLGVDHRGVEFLVAEQRLDDADVDLLLEQVGREAVATMPISALSPLFRVPDYAAPSQLGPGKQAAVRVSAAEDSRWLGIV